MVLFLLVQISLALPYFCLEPNSKVFDTAEENNLVFETKKRTCFVREVSQTEQAVFIESLMGNGWTNVQNLVQPEIIESKIQKNIDKETDIEHFKSNSYYNQVANCSEYRFVTSIIKNIGHEIDHVLRAGISLPKEQEQKLGEELIPKIGEALNGTIVRSGDTHKYLQGLVNQLEKNSTRDSIKYNVILITGTEIENAFATPGGFIYVTEALLNNWVQSETQLLFVLGHELAHVELHHTTALAEYYTMLGQSKNIITELVHAIISRPYSSVHEKQSDELVLHWMLYMGYSPYPVVDMWYNQVVKPQSEPSTNNASTAGLFSAMLDVGLTVVDTVADEAINVIETHPNPGARACFIHGEANKLLQTIPELSSDILVVGKTKIEKNLVLK